VSVKRNERALELCTPRDCDVRVRERVSVKLATRIRYVHSFPRFTNEGVLRARKECERVARNLYALVRLRARNEDLGSGDVQGLLRRTRYMYYLE